MVQTVVVTDASCDISAATAKELGIVVAPLGYELGARRFTSGEHSHEALYATLESGEEIRVEGVAADDFETAFREAGQSSKELICACQSVGSSFTRVSADVAAHRVEVDGFNVSLISPGRSTSALAAIAIVGAKSAANGASRKDVLALMEQISSASDAYFIARDVGQLERSNQLSAVASQSNVGRLDEGVALFRLRSRLSAISLHQDHEASEAALVDAIEEKAAGKPIVLVATHADDEDAAKRLVERASSRLQVESVTTTNIGPVVAGMLGRGTYGLGFCVTS